MSLQACEGEFPYDEARNVEGRHALHNIRPTCEEIPGTLTVITFIGLQGIMIIKMFSVSILLLLLLALVQQLVRVSFLGFGHSVKAYTYS